MKKKVLFTLVIGVFALGCITGCEKEKPIPKSDLPAEIQTYIKTHFPNHTISQSVKDTEGSLTYEIMLSENISLEFNREEEIIDIDGAARLPDSVIPIKMLEYVSENYPDNYITDWEISGENQQIELNNSFELFFNMSGDFLRIDR